MNKNKQVPEVISKVRMRKIGKSVNNIQKDFKDLDDASNYIDKKREEIFDSAANTATKDLKSVLQKYYPKKSEEEQTILTINLISQIASLDKESFVNLMGTLGLIDTNDNVNSENENNDDEYNEFN
ncbi:hypothetical protein DY052_05975 [Apilactobacillus timberlakei]|uniref:hypothetical protein n=1 Tax=Apilactobacillus timberlakei TaxID=2008380 RepID=UPI00112E500B|nr:hypothetical protein [Apilactobacillus timberlakei]TPR14971.1 hypothetical protein DY052_05975 [Apilactobacillus timberlakei]